MAGQRMLLSHETKAKSFTHGPTQLAFYVPDGISAWEGANPSRKDQYIAQLVSEHFDINRLAERAGNLRKSLYDLAPDCKPTGHWTKGRNNLITTVQFSDGTIWVLKIRIPRDIREKTRLKYKPDKGKDKGSNKERNNDRSKDEDEDVDMDEDKYENEDCDSDCQSSPDDTSEDILSSFLGEMETTNSIRTLAELPAPKVHGVLPVPSDLNNVSQTAMLIVDYVPGYTAETLLDSSYCFSHSRNRRNCHGSSVDLTPKGHPGQIALPILTKNDPCRSTSSAQYTSSSTMSTANNNNPDAGSIVPSPVAILEQCTHRSRGSTEEVDFERGYHSYSIDASGAMVDESYRILRTNEIQRQIWYDFAKFQLALALRFPTPLQTPFFTHDQEEDTGSDQDSDKEDTELDPKGLRVSNHEALNELMESYHNKSGCTKNGDRIADAIHKMIDKGFLDDGYSTRYLTNCDAGGGNAICDRGGNVVAFTGLDYLAFTMGPQWAQPVPGLGLDWFNTTCFTCGDWFMDSLDRRQVYKMLMSKAARELESQHENVNALIDFIDSYQSTVKSAIFFLNCFDEEQSLDFVNSFAFGKLNKFLA